MASVTCRQAISEVVGDLRALQMDDHISNRYVLSKLKGYNAIFIKREADQRRLYKSSDVWYTIECFEMKPAKVSDCCNISIPFCSTFMKSVKKIPETYSTNFGNIIREVSSINNEVQYEQVTPRQYAAIQLRPFKSKKKRYYWIENDHIIIPNSEVELIKITAGFKDVFEAKKASACYNSAKFPCEGPLDQTFLCPEYLWEVVRSEAVKDLFNFYKRTVPDNFPDLNSDQKAPTPENPQQQ